MTAVCEVVFELVLLAAATDLPAVDVARRALVGLPGVREVHVDPHRTWAMVGFDPTLTTVAAVTGCLGAHGLGAHRMRRLPIRDELP